MGAPPAAPTPDPMTYGPSAAGYWANAVEGAPASPLRQVAFRRALRRGGNYNACGAAGGCGAACAPDCGPAGCAPVACAPAMRRVWVPNPVERQVQYTAFRREIEEVPFEYPVTRFRQETRTHMVSVPRQVQVPQTREVQFTVMVPKHEHVSHEYQVQLCRAETRTITVEVPRMVQTARSREVPYTVMVPRIERRQETITVMEMQPQQITRTHTVQVPQVVERQVEVPVCRMVPKTIQCQVAVNACGQCR
jgi:hypothetical protein